VDAFAVPKDVPMVKDEAPNPEFFVKWHENVYKNFLNGV
jgi:hypothetical protein